MPEAIGFLKNDDGDILVENGTFVIGPYDNQNIADIMAGFKGWVRYSPLTGMEAIRFLKSKFDIKNTDKFKQKAKLQLEYDGFKQSSIKLNSFEDFQIDAKR